jgi:outer membrane protein assembly factor BamB
MAGTTKRHAHGSTHATAPTLPRIEHPHDPGLAVRFYVSKKEYAMSYFVSKIRAWPLWSLASVLFCMSLGFATSSPAAPRDWTDLRSGNLLIADQFNNRVIEVDPKTHEVVWQFGTGSDKASPDSIVGVNDAERIGPYTLMAGTGIPASTPPLPGCSTPATGCPDNRVLLVNRSGSIVWQYGQAGVAGAGTEQLSSPVHATIFLGFQRRLGAHVMITDQGNQRVIVVDRSKRIVWQYGTTGASGNGPNQLNNPNSAQLLTSGNVLIADENNNRAIEVTPDNMIAAQFTAGGTLNGVAFASRLDNGNTLVTDSNNNRVVELSPNDTIVWEYHTNMEPGSNSSPLPTRAIRLANGNTLISDQFNQRVIEVTQAKQIVFQQGQLNAAGSGPNQLNGPYDAKRIGDFTGQTSPAGEERSVLRLRAAEALIRSQMPSQ